MNRKSIVLAAGLLAAAGAVGATAAVSRQGHGWGHGFWGHGGWGGHGRSSAAALKRRDGDLDGVVTLAEFLKPRTDEFAALDSNKDQALDDGELMAPQRERAQYRIKRFMKGADQNGDGKISKDEFEKGPKVSFAARDIDGDGEITSRDLPPGARDKAAWHGRRQGRGHQDHQEQGMSLDSALQRSAERFKGLDTNADGALDEAELGAADVARQDFARKKAMHAMDQDRDGKVTAEEFNRKAGARFAVLDLNDDGKITADDLPPHERSRWNMQ
jgi:Ca2+-binding EF-hand superfamily protein